jgi:hypothetical protein
MVGTSPGYHPLIQNPLSLLLLWQRQPVQHH